MKQEPTKLELGRDLTFSLDRIEIINDYPPQYQAILEAGMRPDPQRTVFVYMNRIYNPSGKDIPVYQIEHEKIHMLQQMEIGCDTWWDRYLADPKFRLAQEVPAYAHQYDIMCIGIKDRNQRNIMLLNIAKTMAKGTYGAMTTSDEAFRLLKGTISKKTNNKKRKKRKK